MNHYLLEKGIDPDSTNSLDQTALEIAVKNDLLELANMLLEAGARCQ